MSKKLQKSKEYRGLHDQLSKIVNRYLDEFCVDEVDTKPNICFVFTTTPQKAKTLSLVVNKIAQNIPIIHLQVYRCEDEIGVFIYKHKPNAKGFSYTWVEQSSKTNKFLVFGSPPGAWDYRCLSVWKKESDAQDVADKIFNKILHMPVTDWHKRQRQWDSLINSMPDDDDEPVGIYNSTQNSLVEFDALTREKLRALWHQAKLGNRNAQEALMFLLNYWAENLD